MSDLNPSINAATSALRTCSDSLLLSVLAGASTPQAVNLGWQSMTSHSGNAVGVFTAQNTQQFATTSGQGRPSCTVLQRDEFYCLYCGCNLHLKDEGWGSAKQPEHGNLSSLEHVHSRAIGKLHTDAHLGIAHRPSGSFKGKRDLQTLRHAMIARQPHIQAALSTQSFLQQRVTPLPPRLQGASAWSRTQSPQSFSPAEARHTVLVQAASA